MGRNDVTLRFTVDIANFDKQLEAIRKKMGTLGIAVKPSMAAMTKAIWDATKALQAQQRAVQGQERAIRSARSAMLQFAKEQAQVGRKSTGFFGALTMDQNTIRKNREHVRELIRQHQEAARMIRQSTGRWDLLSSPFLSGRPQRQPSVPDYGVWKYAPGASDYAQLAHPRPPERYVGKQEESARRNERSKARSDNGGGPPSRDCQEA